MKMVRAVLFIIIGAIALFYIAFFASEVKAQKPSISIKDFSGGLNTKTNPFNLKMNEFVQLHNYLLNAEFGSLVLRAGDLARTDSLTRPSSAASSVWNCEITSLNTRSDYIEVIMECDSSLPLGDGFWDGQDADSLDRTAGASPPPAWTGKDFTIINSIYGAANDSVVQIWSALGDMDLIAGDSIQVTMDSTGLFDAIDTGGITGLYAFYIKPTTKLLLGVIPGFGSQNQWSALYASESNKYNLTKKLADFIYKGETPLWETWNGFTYVALPRQRPIITNGTKTTHLVPRAPGQLEIVPAIRPDSVDEAWVIDGSPKYALFRMHADTGVGDRAAMHEIGYVSHAVPLFNEWALLYGFPHSASDSANTAVRSDTVLLLLTRTRGDPNGTPLSVDSFYVIDTIIGDPSILDTLKILDSIPNDSLGTAAFPLVGTDGGITHTRPAELHIRTDRTPRGLYDSSYVDSATDIVNVTAPFDRHRTFTAPGAPVLISMDSGAAADDWWPLAPDSIPSNRFHVGWEYGVTKFDTLLELPLMSDMSPTLVISTGATTVLGGSDNTTAITINVPPLTNFDTSQARVVWRRQILNMPNEDSTVVIDDTVIVNFIGVDGRTYQKTEFRRRILYADERIIRLGFRPVGVMLGEDDTLFIDSVDYTLWISGGKTSKSVKIDPRFNFTDNRMDIVKGFFGFKDNLFAWTDNRLFRSKLDTPVFVPFNDVLFDPENGDVITRVAQVGPNIIAFWSNGLTELYDPTADLPQKGSPVEGFGCFAPQSLVDWGGSLYFGALDGIRAISSHPVKTFGVPNTVISRKINDQIIDGRSDSLKQTLVGTVGPDGQTLRFCYPSIDTTWIWHPPISPGDDPLGAWTTRDFSFFQATHYDTNSIEGLQRSGNTVYAKTGDERIFDMEVNTATYFDSGLGTGVGTIIQGQMQTRPLFDDHNTWQIHRLGLLKSGGGRNVVVNVLNDSLSNVANETFLATDPRYSVHAMQLHQGTFLSLLYATQIGTTPDTLRKIDIWGRFIGSPWVR